MNIRELISVFLIFAIVMIAALGLGLVIIEVIKRIFFKRQVIDYNLATLIGTATLIGLGSIGYLGLIAGLFGQFNKATLIVIIFTTLVVGGRQVGGILRQLIAHRKLIGQTLANHPIITIFLTLTLLLLSMLYLGAMQLPYVADELHYHFPQAGLIISTGKVPINLGGHYFYGNIPKLMEITLAIGTAISGYSLAHALHFGYLLGFLLLVAGILTRHYSLKTAAVAIFLVALYDDFTLNSISGYVDAATVSLEIGALLLVGDWLISKKGLTLSIAGILIGLALSIKYSGIATLAFLAIVILSAALIQYRSSIKKILKATFPFGLLVSAFAGYWYVKNAIQFGNPFYPLYFGHPGVDELSYTGLINAIQQFGLRTWENFIFTPRRFLSFNELPIYFSFYLALFAIFIKKVRWFHLVIIGYYLSYLTYWFFIATHQTRFLMPAIVAALIATAVLLTNLKPLPTAATITAIVLVAILANKNFKPYYHPSDWQTYFDTKLRKIERSYALGESRSEFLNRQFGCYYAIVETLELKGWEGRVIDNWTVWHDSSVPFYSRHNAFSSFTFNVADKNYNLVGDLKTDDFRYIYFNVDTKQRHLANPDPEVIIYRTGRDLAENYLLERSDIIYENGFCKLYRIDFERLAKDRSI